MKESLFPGELSNPSNDGSCTTLLARLSYIISSCQSSWEDDEPNPMSDSEEKKAIVWFEQKALVELILVHIG